MKLENKEVRMSGGANGLSLVSGGLDSQLAVRVLERAGAYVEGVCFATPFFSPASARKAAEALGLKLHVIDFTADEIALIENPPHGFGGAMNPCIDCHATMIRRAGEMMSAMGFDFVSTGEVMGQRPMSQNRQSLETVAKASGLQGRLVRPLSALLLEPTIPEDEGLLDRSAFFDIRGRARERQIALAKEFGIVDYPSPAGGCKLTEEGYGRKLKDLLVHEGLGNREYVELLSTGRRFRLPGGSGLVVGRDRNDNARLQNVSAPVTLATENCPGPTAVMTSVAAPSDVEIACRIVASYSKFDRLETDIHVKVSQPPSRVAVSREVASDRDSFRRWMVC